MGLFTSPTIIERFSCGRTVEATIEELKTGQTKVEDIPLIRVVRRKDKLLALDHRRLFAFRNALPRSAAVPMRLLLSDVLIEQHLSPNSKSWNSVGIQRTVPIGGKVIQAHC